MNSLLIYNDNIPSNLVIDFQSKIGLTYKFQIGKQELLNSSFTIDKKIDLVLKREIEKSQYDCIFIPYSLSDENYLEFLGIRFACHIRLTQEFNNTQTPIVFFGYESESDINKLSDLGSILFTKGVYTTKKITIPDFRKQLEFVTKTHKKIYENIFLKDFTKRVTITTSGNYSTHHSTTNEWSIYRWSKALGIANEHLKQIENKIDNNLHFKYLKAQFPIKETVNAKNLIIFNSGRVLHIDDEIDKGWEVIFKKICSSPNLKYDSIGSNFKNATDSNQVLTSVLQKIKEFNPDVILLDFRLHDDDFETSHPEKILGYKILQKIKEGNKGIQVIVLSATNKIWNLLKLQKTGANNFVLKESPQLSTDENYSKSAISDIYKSINESLERKYLKEIFVEWKKTKNYNINTVENFIQESDTALNIAWEQIERNYLDFGFLTLFQSIEGLANKLYQSGEYSDSLEGVLTINKKTGEKNKWEWMMTHNKDKLNGDYFSFGKSMVKKDRTPTTIFKVSCFFKIIYKKDEVFLKNIGKMNKLRNDIAHGKSKKVTTKNDLLKILKILKEIRNS